MKGQIISYEHCSVPVKDGYFGKLLQTWRKLESNKAMIKVCSGVSFELVVLLEIIVTIMSYWMKL